MKVKNLNVNFENIKKSLAIGLTAIVIGGSVGYILANIDNSTRENNIPKNDSVGIDDTLYIDEIKNLIYSSSDLSLEEMNYFYNEDFLNDILPYVNLSVSSKKLLRNKLKNLSIKKYEDKTFSTLGYYNPSEVNVLYLNSEMSEREKNSTLPHEYAHLCQYGYEYSLIDEAGADIVASEYFNGEGFFYLTEKVLVKKLMEIIGVEPIKIYLYTGDFEPISNELKKYFNNQEYIAFLETLVLKSEDSEDFDYEKRENNYKLCNELLDLLYYRKYNIPSSKDEVIPFLGKKSLNRYYFNSKKINRENAFIEYESMEYFPVELLFSNKTINTVVEYDNSGKLIFLDVQAFKEKNGSFTNDYNYYSYTDSGEKIDIFVNDEGCLIAFRTDMIKDYITPIDEKFSESKSYTKSK